MMQMTPAATSTGEAVWWRGGLSGAISLAERLGAYRGAIVDIDLLHECARKETGCDDFGDPEYLEPLTRLVREFKLRAEADAMGRQVLVGVLLLALRNRLRIRDALRMHPEIERRKIVAPLFIVGLPRTGSTLLQGLLACAPGLRTPLRWETELAARPPALCTRGEIARHVRRVRYGARAAHWLSPRLASVHEFGADLPEECNPLLMTSLRALFFALLFDCPEYEDHVYASRFRNAYEWHKLHLQVLSFGGPERTWVLKAPAHLASLDALLRAYPDARVIFTHRDPVESIPSMASLAACLRALSTPAIDRLAMGRSVMKSLARMHGAGDAARERWPEGSPPFLDVGYETLVRDPLGTLRGILRHFGIDEGAHLEVKVGRYLASLRQRRRRTHRYRLAEFGLDQDEIRAVFSREIDWIANPGAGSLPMSAARGFA